MPDYTNGRKRLLRCRPDRSQPEKKEKQSNAAILLYTV